jgi:anion-transporting  ArsA/GET3 family ATPase
VARRHPVAGTVDELLTRRILFVAGKGGSGKTSVAAALSLLAARAGKRVLAIEVDAKGDLSHALGARPVGFEPELVQPNLSVLALIPDESLREYLSIYFKVPRFLSLTPLSRIYDFIASSVPGPKDMLVIGKIAYEERRRRKDGTPEWDVIVVDCAATGQALAQIMAAREMKKLTRGGMIRGQLDWIDAAITDTKRTGLVITALPEEMPVVEAVELYQEAQHARYVAVVACFLNRVAPPVQASAAPLLHELASAGRRGSAARVSPTGAEHLEAAIEVMAAIHARGEQEAHRLRAGITTAPVIEVPLCVAKPGLATTRAVADAIRAEAG